MAMLGLGPPDLLSPPCWGWGFGTTSGPPLPTMLGLGFWYDGRTTRLCISTLTRLATKAPKEILIDISQCHNNMLLSPTTPMNNLLNILSQQCGCHTRAGGHTAQPSNSSQNTHAFTNTIFDYTSNCKKRLFFPCDLGNPPLSQPDICT